MIIALKARLTKYLGFSKNPIMFRVGWWVGF